MLCAAIEKAQVTPNQLTSIHTDLMQVCSMCVYDCSTYCATWQFIQSVLTVSSCYSMCVCVLCVSGCSPLLKIITLSVSHFISSVFYDQL